MDPFANQAQQANGLSEAPKSELESVNSRLTIFVERIAFTAQQLGQLADKIHGERATGESNGLPTPVRFGVLGAINDNLDRIERAIDELGHQDDRNCNLA